jgi:hypothetical protein
MVGAVEFKSSIFSPALYKNHRDSNTENCNFSCSFVRMRNVVSNVKGGTQIEGAEENILTYERSNNVMLENTV